MGFLPRSWTLSNDRDDHGNPLEYAFIVLDIEHGALQIVVHRHGERYDDVPNDHWQWVRLPGVDREVSSPLLRVPPRLGYRTSLRDPAAINALLADVAPLAETILDHTEVVPGTGDRDWSVAALSAADELGLAVQQSDHRPDLPPGGSYAQASDVFAARPDLIDPAWATAADAELNQVAAEYGPFLPYRHPDVRDQLRAPDDAPDGPGMIRMVGMRAWLYRHRQDAAGGRPASTGAPHG